MLYNMLYKKLDAFNRLSQEQKIMFVYRYVSLATTSLFYLLAPIEHTIYKKLFIITCIVLSSIILNYLYIKNQNDFAVVKALVLIETIGNSIILIPSGGLNSPYVWYSLNTIFIAAVMLDIKYYLINLTTYLVASTWVAYAIFNDKHQLFWDFVEKQSNLIISFVLISIAFWLLQRYIKQIKMDQIKLLASNKQLRVANQQVKESVNHIMELYQSVQLFSNLRNKNELIERIIEYTGRVIPSAQIVFYNTESNEMICSDTGTKSRKMSPLLMNKVKEQWDNMINLDTAIQIKVEEDSFLAASVKSNYMTYGVLGIQLTERDDSLGQIGSIDQLKFIADLSSIVLEKFELEKVNDKLIIAEEQNRIANEIHDSVLQRLFSTSFGIYGLMKKLSKSNIQITDSDLNMIRNSIDQTMKELRSTIYGLSWKKKGADNFITDMLKYIDEIKKMHHTEINLNIIGETELLSCAVKKAIYRIICEGIGNAVRHGKASHIEISMNIKPDDTQLRLVDNGDGFDLHAAEASKQGGLGIKNINFLVNSMSGQIDYQSAIGKGTTIGIMMPTQAYGARRDEVV